MNVASTAFLCGDMVICVQMPSNTRLPLELSTHPEVLIPKFSTDPLLLRVLEFRGGEEERREQDYALFLFFLLLTCKPLLAILLYDEVIIDIHLKSALISSDKRGWEGAEDNYY